MRGHLKVNLYRQKTKVTEREGEPLFAVTVPTRGDQTHLDISEEPRAFSTRSKAALVSAAASSLYTRISSVWEPSEFVHVPSIDYASKFA